MTNTDTPVGGHGYCTDCENKTIIRNGRCGCGSGRVIPSVASDTAGLPSDHARLIDLLTLEAEAFEQLAAEGRNVSYVDPASAFGQSAGIIREAIAALSRAPEASGWQVQDHDGVWKNAPSMTAAYGARSDGTVRAVRATPPSPQPALALIEEMELAMEPFAKAAQDWSPEENAGFTFADDENLGMENEFTVGDLRRAASALASAKRFKEGA